jgi:hypothetical protein
VSHDEAAWRDALEAYWRTPTVKRNRALENFMCGLDAEEIKALDKSDWHDFLRHKYFPWKFAEYLPTMLEHLEANSLNDLASIKESLFDFDLTNVWEGLTRAKKMHGLGWIAASGLLAVLFPKHFGTFDRRMITALCEVDSLPERAELLTMKELLEKKRDLTQGQGVLLVDIMRRKAAELNAMFRNDEWTPRKIDMILYAAGAYAKSVGACAKQVKPHLRPATPNQIRSAARKNLSRLKLSVMTKASIEYAAERLAEKGRPQPTKREWARIDKSNPRRGREIVKSAAAPASVWGRRS